MGSRNRQAGMALLVFLILLLAGASAFAISVQDRNRGQTVNEVNRYRQLNQAERSLMGYIFEEKKRPGELRLADPHGGGSAHGNTDWGFFPWKQLQAARATDERLWYFISNDFSDLSTKKLNYDSSVDTLTLDGQNGFAAILIAPGPPVDGSQAVERPSDDRDDIVAYLEGDNASTGDNSFTRTGGVGFNDTVQGIHKDAVLQRAASYTALKFIGRLQEYLKHTSCNEYPAPAAYDSEIANDNKFFTNLASHIDPFSGDELIVGMVPVSNAGVLPSEWVDCGANLNNNIDSFLEQRWYRFMRFARAEGGIGCIAPDCLVVKNAVGTVLHDDVEALVIMSGMPLTGQSWSGSPSVGDYFEGENDDDDNVFQKGLANDTFNDRLFIVPRVAP